MHIQVKQGFIQEEATELIVVNLFEGVTEPGGALKAVDDVLGGLISQLIAAGELKGKLGETTLIHSHGKLSAPRVLVTGLGKQAEFDVAQARKAAAAAAKRVRDLGLTRFSTVVHGAGRGGLAVADAAQAVAEGSLLGAYRFEAHRRNRPENDTPPVAEMVILEANATQLPAVQQGVATGQVLGEVTNWARDLVNEPPNFLPPRELAQRIRGRAQQVGLSCQVLGEQELAELGAGSFLAIAKGSDEEGQFIVLEHTPKGYDIASLPTVVLVGKAITFDTGGISIKPAEEMWKMKDDMAGGAATAAALLAAATLNWPVHAVGLIPATENMPSGGALKPGDVITAMNGKTVEIISTDAEGRQVLADALCYASRYHPTAVVDIATLTGSIGLALGRQMAGLFCDDDDLRRRLLKASEFTGEPLWHMPLYKPYRKLLESDVADVKHTGGRYGGAILGALFLQEFVEGFSWAHLDIASPVWQDEASPYAVRGGTGFGARLLFELLRSYAAQ